MNTIHIITEDEKIKLEAELKELKEIKRPEVIEHLQYARAQGDLSENAEYHEARDVQANVEERIEEIEHILRVSQVVTHKGKSETVMVGSFVTVTKKGAKHDTIYAIGHPDAAKEGVFAITADSPIGVALIGKKIGDKVSVILPSGSTDITIVSIK